jgi:hypothetical protein
VHCVVLAYYFPSCFVIMEREGDSYSEVEDISLDESGRDTSVVSKDSDSSVDIQNGSG